MTAKIAISGVKGEGKFALVDDDVFEKLSQYKWYLSDGYAARTKYLSNGKYRHIKMHRLVTNAQEGEIVDHINGDRLDNRRKNLRLCTNAENTMNQKIRENNTSGYKGVSYSKYHSKWVAHYADNGKSIHIGYFINVVEAAKAYDYYALKYYKEFAKLNFPNEVPKLPNKKKSSSEYRGVSWCSRDQVWQVQIQKDGKRYCVGSFDDETKAALSYNKKATELFKDKAKLNKVVER